jgi:DNA-directed RNA polymerase subunit RPC12/RpoP
MALKFKCPKCGEEVIVRHVKRGEEAVCRYCGAKVTVPETSVETDEEPDLTKTRRYRAEREPGKLKGLFEDYRCPAYGEYVVPDWDKTEGYWEYGFSFSGLSL